jgi:SAM-dependent methyltransferase
MDWAAGQYEKVAPRLVPASLAAVGDCRLLPTDDVLDLGCGSGNATEIIAGLGCRVTAVDPTPRLLHVAAERITRLGLDASFLEGTAESIPAPDDSFDAVVSVFAAIFTPEPAMAAKEMSRVLRPRGRIALTAWEPEGAGFRLGSLRRAAVARALGLGAGTVAAPWHEGRFVSSLFAAPEFSVTTRRSSILFTSDSVDSFLEEELATSPMWIDARQVLEPIGELPSLVSACRELLIEANETNEGFRVSSSFDIHLVQRDLLAR